MLTWHRLGIEARGMKQDHVFKPSFIAPFPLPTLNYLSLEAVVVVGTSLGSVQRRPLVNE